MDETLRLADLGVSALRGKNASVGDLAAFLRAVESKQIRTPCALVIENLDKGKKALARD